MQRLRNLRIGPVFVSCLLAAALAGCSSPRSQVPDTLTAEPIGKRLVGSYIRGGVWQGFDAIHAVESELGFQFAITQWFTNWDNPWETHLVEMVLDEGRIPLITWQNHTQTLDEIAAGTHDDYIRAWARGVKECKEPVYVRLFPEMNGDWVPWGGDPETLVRAWRYVANLFAEEGAANVRWVWSPNITDWPRTDANRMEHYYPGDAYVDVLALDGYNWGEVRDWSTWRSFEDIFSEPYERVAKIGPQPVWLAEVASAEKGGDKGAWISDMLSSRAFPRLEAIVWFSERKDADWRIHSSPASLGAFRDWFALHLDEPVNDPLAER